MRVEPPTNAIEIVGLEFGNARSGVFFQQRTNQLFKVRPGNLGFQVEGSLALLPKMLPERGRRRETQGDLNLFCSSQESGLGIIRDSNAVELELFCQVQLQRSS